MISYRLMFFLMENTQLFLKTEVVLYHEFVVFKFCSLEGTEVHSWVRMGNVCSWPRSAITTCLASSPMSSTNIVLFFTILCVDTLPNMSFKSFFLYAIRKFKNQLLIGKCKGLKSSYSSFK